MKSSEYWAKRQEDRMQRMHWRANKAVNKVNKAFDESQERLKKDVRDLLGKFDGLGMVEARKYLNESITYDRYKELLEIYNSTEEKIVKDKIGQMLRANAIGYRIRRKEALQQSIERERLAMTGSQLDNTKSHLSGVFKDTMSDIGFDDVSRKLINETLQSKWLGGNYSSRIWHNQRVMAKNLEDNILQGFVSGKRYSDMADELVTMTNYGKFAANRLIRTETSYIVNKADLEGSKRRGIKAKKFEANLDSRTSKVCREHNQKIIPIDKIRIGENAPPLHPFCRSFLSDLLEDWDYETDEELDRMISSEYTEKFETKNSADYMGQSRNVDEVDWSEIKSIKIDSAENNITIENDSKMSKQTVKVLDKLVSNAKELMPEGTPIPEIVIADKKHFKEGQLGGYDYMADKIYIPNIYKNRKDITDILSSGYFASKEPETLIIHEVGHKLHWDEIKAFYNTNKKRYNSLKDAKEEFDKTLRIELKKKLMIDEKYIEDNISLNASINFDKTSKVNEYKADKFVKDCFNKKGD